jgi:ATP-dependent DNA helicase DinG
MNNDLKTAFSILKKEFSSYEDRPQQMEMAEAVLSCLQNNERLLVEAGTGVGKSFAYLIPAILSNEKTIVSTASIALQDQLIHKDLEFLRKVLPQKFSFAMLKGKNNYLCLKREREFSEMTEPFIKFREWAAETETGDKDELDFIPDFWSRVCGDSHDCGGTQCPFYSDCFYYSHFRNLFRKDIIVINHHLLLYDLLAGFNILPFHKQLIMDEAHQIENIISHVFGSILSHPQVIWLLYRLKGMKIAVDHLFQEADSFFREKFFASPGMTNTRTEPIPDAIIEGLKKLKEQLALDKVIHRLNLYKDSAESDELRDRAETTIMYVLSLEGIIDDFIARGDDGKVYYMTVNKKGLELRSSLVESQKTFGDLIKGYESMIMTSATLTAGGDFSFIRERLGIVCHHGPVSESREMLKQVQHDSSDAGWKEMVIGSPFDYRKQALLYLDKDLPSPDRGNSGLFQEQSLRVIEKLINASQGRALVLFTSYSHLRFASDNIAADYPCKCQGEMPPARLIEWFKDTQNSVLLATATFWQGIDIKGEDLSLVVIVKMPFGSPGDPVYDERCRRLGPRWFHDLALPSAILQVRQGFGRLIRSIDDFGVVAILDTRVLHSSYGMAVISSLPEMNIVHDVGDVKRFFESVPHNENIPLSRSDGSRTAPAKKEKRFSVKKGYNVKPEGKKIKTVW